MLRARPLALLLLGLLVLAGCKRSTTAEAERSGVLRIATFEPKSIDPNQVQDGQGREVVENLFEGLCSRAADGAPIPGAAARWTTSEDGLTWTFTLREGLVWSDGHPLDARDFVWSFRRALRPGTTNPNAALLYPLANAEAFNTGAMTDEAAVGVRATADNRRVVFSLERPYAQLPRLLATAYAMPAPRHVVEAHAERWTRPEHIVSNGPYTLESHDHEEQMVLEANPRHRDAEELGIRRAVYRFTSDVNVAWQWYELNEVDWSAGLIPPERIDALRRTRAAQLRIDPYAGLYFFYMNASKPPFDDSRVRRAFDLAIDRGRLVRQVLSGGEQPASSPIPPGMSTAPVPPRVRHDPEAARALLAAAGYGASKPLPAVTLIYNTNEKNRRLAEFLQRNLKEALGARVEVSNVDWKTFLEQLGSPGYDAGLLAMGGFDALDFAQLVRGDSPDNRARWKHAEYDEHVRRARNAPTESERDLHLASALKIFDAELPVIPLFQLTRQVLLRPGLVGYLTTPDNIHPLRWLRWEEGR